MNQLLTHEECDTGPALYCCRCGCLLSDVKHGDAPADFTLDVGGKHEVTADYRYGEQLDLVISEHSMEDRGKSMHVSLGNTGGEGTMLCVWREDELDGELIDVLHMTISPRSKLAIDVIDRNFIVDSD